MPVDRTLPSTYTLLVWCCAHADVHGLIFMCSPCVGPDKGTAQWQGCGQPGAGESDTASAVHVHWLI